MTVLVGIDAQLRIRERGTLPRVGRLPADCAIVRDRTRTIVYGDTRAGPPALVVHVYAYRPVPWTWPS